jgi:hypothetical protein
MKNIAIIATLAAAVALVACGGGSSKKDPTAVSTSAATAKPGNTPVATASKKDESAFAATMLLQLSDFPAGYVLSNSSQTNEESPLDPFCGTGIEAGKTGRAVTGDFAANEAAPSISETVVIFGDQDAATAALDQVPDRIACAIKAINDGKLDQATIKFSGAESREANIAAPGDKHYAYQIRMDAVTTDPAAPDNETVYFLLVYARSGRVGYSLTGTAFGTQFDVAAVTAAAKAAAAKIKQQP